MLDPFVQQVMAGARSGCFRLLDLAPDRFRQSEYYRVHYRLTGIREEEGTRTYALEGSPQNEAKALRAS